MGQGAATTRLLDAPAGRCDQSTATEYAKIHSRIEGSVRQAGEEKFKRGEVVKRVYFVLLLLVAFACGIASAQKNQSSRGKAKMKIEILYFDSCPSYKDAIANVKAALKEKNLQADLLLIKVEDEVTAEKVGFQGSPSVRINGKDVEGLDEGFTFGCRLYKVNGKPATAPNKEAISAKLDSLMK
jgi:hypothetical protein